MSSEAEIRWDFSRVDHMFDSADSAYERAAVRTLNKAIQKVRTGVKRAVATEKQIRPQRLVHKRIKETKATRGNYVAIVRILTHPVPVILLSGARDTRRAARRAGRGVIAGGQTYPKAFIAQGKSRTPQVFQRKGSERMPIEVVTIPIKDTAERSLRERIHEANEYVAEKLPAEVMRMLGGAR